MTPDSYVCELFCDYVLQLYFFVTLFLNQHLFLTFLRVTF